MTTNYSIKDGKVTVTTEFEISEIESITIGLFKVYLRRFNKELLHFTFATQQMANDFYEEINKLLEQ